MVLGAAAQKRAAGAAIDRLLAAHETETLGVETLGAVDVVDKQPDRADFGDFERPRQQHPFDIEGRPARVIIRALWFVANHVLTVKTPLGRKVRPEMRAHGGPLIRVKARHLDEAGVEHVAARVTGVREGLPVLDGGRVVEAANVIWCTGFRLDFGWIDLSIIGDDGYPLEDRGVVASAPGVYFVGLPFQRSFASMLIGGVGKDAAYVARHIAHAPRNAGKRG